MHTSISRNICFIEPITTAALIGLGGSALGGIFGRGSARQSMSFQRRAAKQAHQWEVEDLRKAGLNPILSGTGGPGARPGGGAMPTTPDFASSAIGAARLSAEIKNIESLTDLNKAKQGAIGGATGVGSRLEQLMDYVGGGTEKFIQNLLDKMEMERSGVVGSTSSAKKVKTNNPVTRVQFGKNRGYSISEKEYKRLIKKRSNR